MTCQCRQMDPILILAALVLFIEMEVHQNATVMEMETLVLDIHTLGINNAAFGRVVNAIQEVISSFLLELKICLKLGFFFRF